MRLSRTDILDKLIYLSLILFVLTFYLDLPVNFIVVALVLGLLKLFIVRPQIKLNSRHLLFIFLFCGAVFLSIITADNAVSLLRAYKGDFLSPLAALAVAYVYKFDKKNVHMIISCFALVLFSNAIIAFFQFFYGISIENGRIVGFFSDKMLLAAVHMMILPILLSIVVFGKDCSLRWRIFYLITVIVNIPAVILSGTRIVWIGLFISYILILILGIRNKLKLLAIVALFIAAGAVLIQVDSYSQHRFDSITNMELNGKTNRSNYERLEMWNSAWQMFKDHPFLGVGYGNFEQEVKEKYKMPADIIVPRHAHNIFLNIMAQSGFVGLAGLLALFTYIYYNIYKQWRSDKNIAVIAYFFCVFTYNIDFLTDVLFCGPSIRMPTYVFWLITGMYLSLNKYIIIKK